jgi:hypothetical protein
MYSLTITEEYAGKTMLEIITSLKDTDGFKSKLGLFTETSCIVSVDDEIIVFPALRSTIACGGQLLKIFPLFSGG